MHSNVLRLVAFKHLFFQGRLTGFIIVLPGCEVVCLISQVQRVVPFKQGIIDAKVKVFVFLESISKFANYVSLGTNIHRVPTKSVWRGEVGEPVMVLASDDKVPAIDLMFGILDSILQN